MNTKSTDIYIVLTTEKDKKSASALSMKILESKLSACVSIRQINSFFWWEEKITNTDEFEIMMKTTVVNLDNLIKKIRELHSYQIPELIYFKASCSEEYKTWLNSLFN